MTASMAGLRIGLITASASRLGGGVFEAVATHAAMLKDCGAAPHIFALHDRETDTDRARFAGIPVQTSRVVGPGQIGFSPDLLPALLAAKLDCLHLHGIWMYPSAAASRWAAITGRPYFISPHGMLDPWITARGKLKKAIARLAYERRSWQRATAFHALTPREAEDIARESGRRHTHVIPNAGPAPQARATEAMPAPRLVYIGRIHAKKNLVALVEAWMVAARPPEATLAIAGWGDQQAIDDLQAAIARGDGSVSFIGPVFGDAKDRLLDSARFAVLPSHSEGLPMAILEAWARGVPSIMTAQCNLPEGFAAGASLECCYSSEAIADAISHALTLDAQTWRQMADAALTLANTTFSSRAVSESWVSVYSEAIAAAREKESARS